MRYMVSGAGLLAALILMSASGSMNFLFWIGQGQSARESTILGLVSVAFDIFKSVLPFCVAWAWAMRKRAYVIVSSVLFALFFCFSMMSALGFAAGNRGYVAGGREALALRLEETEGELERAKAQRKALPTHRVASVIEEEIKGMQKDRFWTGSQSCNDPSGREAQNFCKKLADRNTERAASLAADRLSLDIERLSREAEALKGQGAGQTKDPQADMVATISGLDEAGSKKAINIFVALLVELGAAFGLFLAMGHSFSHIPSATPAPISLKTVVAETAQALERVAVPALTQARKPAPLRLQMLENGELVVDQHGESA
jgi:hypothetical protein